MQCASRNCWLGLVIVLGVSGCGRSTAVPKAGTPPPSPDGSAVLARVGDYVITQKQVEARIRNSTKNKDSEEANLSNPDIVQIALAAIVDQVVWAKAAEDAGYGKDPQISRDAYLYKAQLMSTAYLADKINKEAMPTEQEITEFYEKWKINYTKPVRIAARHIQFSSREKAEDVLKQLLNGGDFPKLARQYSEDSNTKDIGGALGYISLEEGALGIGKDPEFLNEALKLKKGELSPVIHSGKGWHIVQCDEREGGEALPLDEVREDVIRRIRNSGKLSDVYNYKLSEMRQKYHTEIFEDQVNKVTGVGDSAERLWEVVDMQPTDRGQVEVLRRITFDFPNDDLADDAQLRMAYIYAVKLKEPKRAEKALSNLRARFPRSKLMPAVEWLQAHLTDAEIDLKNFDDLKMKASKS